MRRKQTIEPDADDVEDDDAHIREGEEIFDFSNRLHLHRRTLCALSWSLFSPAEHQNTMMKDKALTMLERG